MGETPYSKKLRDPKWQRKRLEILQRDGFSCRDCGRGDMELHIEHAYYVNGLNPWDYEDRCLRSLCSDCHKRVESLKREILDGFANSGPAGQYGLFKLSTALASGLCEDRPFIEALYELISQNLWNQVPEKANQR